MDKVHARHEPAFNIHISNCNTHYDHQVGDTPFVSMMPSSKTRLNEKSCHHLREQLLPVSLSNLYVDEEFKIDFST